MPKRKPVTPQPIKAKVLHGPPKLPTRYIRVYHNQIAETSYWNTSHAGSDSNEFAPRVDSVIYALPPPQERAMNDEFPMVNCDECGERVHKDEYDKCACGAEVHDRCMDRHLGHCGGLAND